MIEWLTDPKVWIGFVCLSGMTFVGNKVRVAANSVIKIVGDADTNLRYLVERSDQLWNIHTLRDDDSLFQVATLLKANAATTRLLKRSLTYQGALIKLALLSASKPENVADVSAIQQELTEELMRE